MIKKLAWWLGRCIECWDEDVELVDRETLRCYEADEEWNATWDAFGMGSLIDEDIGANTFPGLSNYLISRT